jgi:hypothetical protein
MMQAHALTEDEQIEAALAALEQAQPTPPAPVAAPAAPQPPRATHKPDVGRVGRQPPPAAQNRLRSLSQLGLVRIASGSEVLLPGHVPDHLEHPGTQPDDRLRRGLARPGVATVAGRAGPEPACSALAAVDKYIAEREEKRLATIRYTETQAI